MENGLWRDGERISTGLWDMSNSTFWQQHNNETSALVLKSGPLPEADLDRPVVMADSKLAFSESFDS